jgi:hypothetical protein
VIAPYALIHSGGITHSVHSRVRRCEAMTLRCRPREGAAKAGTHTPQQTDVGRAGDNRNLSGYGSPPSRGRQQLVHSQNTLSTQNFRVSGNPAPLSATLRIVALGPRFRGDERREFKPPSLPPRRRAASRARHAVQPRSLARSSRVFACGDMRRGQSLVVWAIREGRQAAHAVDKFLMGSTTLPR